ncbi:B12-binding domain-containing radical SAM protein [Shewanella sp. UCD-KL12]|uniref:B12-binding domain-containing radical SAM protein n=1 Tax=Shewanella sp. UCD-KL12 TaxID=1917163 RepID=UPI000970B970|nr:radical SAM protein [Shewanella sp. UCD-KL12]
MDALVVSPGGREAIYQSLGSELTAVEPPLWARLITGYLLDREYDVDILDTEALSLSPKKAAETILARQPSLVILVVYGHQPSASTQMMSSARALAEQVKLGSLQQKILILGGHVAALPERTLLEEPVDFVCSGEGPKTCEQLITVLQKGGEYENVAGLFWQDEFGQVKSTPNPPLINDLDESLHGKVWDRLPMDKYRAHNWQCFGELDMRQPYASIYTTLGCPYKCVFCCINAPFTEHKYRCRSPQAVVDEVSYLYHEYGVKTFKIIDEMFVLKKNHYLKICELLAAKPFAPELNIWAYARVDTVRKETLSLMRSAGIRWLALGIESADETVRDGANKSLNSQNIIDIVRDIQSADINVIGNFIFGLPQDSVASMEHTLELAKQLKCDFVNFYSAMAYPGSQLYQDAIANDTPLPEFWSGYSQHSYNCLPLETEFETSATVLKFRDDAFHEYFESVDYLEFVEDKFGVDTRVHIQSMSQSRLKRQILTEGKPDGS